MSKKQKTDEQTVQQVSFSDTPKGEFTPVYVEQNKAGQVKVEEPKELDDALDKKKSSKFAGGRSYLFEYNHKKVVITLINGVELQGKLHVGDDNFNVQLELDSKRILVPKHSILFIKLCD